ncbi:MAG: LysM peptidoglycan-binding domain-containing protein [Calditrichaeota bacterium]|nr:LysM peptidoglycan-binding domain-containing protein [Calditrichota bacterium]
MRNRSRTLFIYILSIFWLLGCQSIHFTQKDSPHPPAQTSLNKTQEAPVTETDFTLLLMEQLLDSATIYMEMPDSLLAEQYFNRIYQLLDSLEEAEVESSALDSFKIRLENQYNRFAHLFLQTAADSLSPGAILDELGHMQAELDTQVTDSTVAIPDVIDETHSMRIPMVLNKQVQQAIKYFTTNPRGRRVFRVWLRRSGKYEKLIKDILREEGVPEELFYLAMIESGFNPHARSYARAVGIWQFIASTGRAYGLRQSWWFDERRDPVKATRAAARLLKDLYQRFGDWYLAMAGYNFSPRKIERRLARYGVDSYWDLPRLPRQTRNYIPTFIAAAMIAKEPEKYGFYVEKAPPVEFDTVTVRECVDLNVVAECVGSTFEEIKDLNPAILRWCTPPDVDEWTLYLPRGTREKFLTNYAKIPDDQKLTWIHHRIRYGETLSTIARKYGVSIREIKRFNKIRGSMIRAGSYLVIPVPQNRQAYRKYARRSTRTYSRRKPVTHVPGRVKKVYLVKKGDTLWDIARKFNVTISQLRYWNGLGYSRIIRPGQTLNIWLPESSGRSEEIARGNTRSASPPLATDSGNPASIIHVVQKGETLWDIAQRYGVRLHDIKRWNNIRSNLIRPGDRLRILTNGETFQGGTR